VTVSTVRLVMIVDNAVDGDSRVQKMAESNAAAGFDVTVVGRSPDQSQHEWTLGLAKVVLLPVPLDLLEYSATHPGRSLRWPMAYADKAADARGSYAKRSRANALAELKNGRALAKSAGAGRSLVDLEMPLRKTWLLVRAGWHGIRHIQYTSARNHRKSESSVLDRLRAHTKATLGGHSSWRSLDPTLVDFERGMEAFIESLQPDLIHAHDFRMVGIAVRIAERRRGQGHSCYVVYDAHEFMPGVHMRNLSWRLGNERHEAVYAPRADAVVTVSDRLAHMLKDRHRLHNLPTTVLNAPATTNPPNEDSRDIRSELNLPPSTPLLVYIGSPAPQRGLMTVVEALPQLPECHAAVVLPPATPLAEPLIVRATELDVAERFHVLAYVPPDEVVSYIASATIGVIPLHHQLNHEISLITKYFDYAQAKLPIVVSDVETMGRTTIELGNGEVFTAQSTDGFVEAVRKVLLDPSQYARNYTPSALESWTWEAQSEKLIGLYKTLLVGPQNPVALTDSAQ